MSIDRIVIDKKGTAVTLKRAEYLGIKEDIIFRREDGSTWGAPRELEDIAYRLWPKTWVSVYDISNRHPMTIAEYREKKLERAKILREYQKNNP